MNFFSLSKSPNTSFGYKVDGVDGVPSALDNIKGSIINTSRKYRSELTKYREIAAFNQQLSKGYVKNLEAMVDVSKILNYYVEIFNVLRSEFEQNDKLMGSTLTPIDINYLETLTKSKIDELNNKFFTESEKLKKLYSTYGKTEEVARVVDAQNALRATTDGADQTFANLRKMQNAQGAAMGGAKSKKTKKVPSGAKKPAVKSSKKPAAKKPKTIKKK
jgi:hypothetical protein